MIEQRLGEFFFHLYMISRGFKLRSDHVYMMHEVDVGSKVLTAVTGRNYLWDYFMATCLVYSSVSKMEPVCFSETLVNFYCTTQCYIPEYSTF
jgi:hypothetical protein